MQQRRWRDYLWVIYRVAKRGAEQEAYGDRSSSFDVVRVLGMTTVRDEDEWICPQILSSWEIIGWTASYLRPSLLNMQTQSQ